MKLKIVYVDDSKLQLSALKNALEKKSFTDTTYPEERFQFSVQTCDNFQEFKKTKSLDLLILDIDLGKKNPEGESKNILEYVKEHFPNSVVVMYSNTRNESEFIEYMTLGADNFISKSTSKDKVHIPIIQTYMMALKRREVFDETSLQIDDERFVGETINEIKNRVLRIIESKAIRSVLITGETGTGKEVVADVFENILISKKRKNTPFIRVNCGAIAESLIESELFGSVRGAFTGALDRKGIFEVADGGWVFLDEVATLSEAAQNSLMRVIENNELKRVGSTTTKKINVRVISATNENLKELSSNRRFRHDLIQRLNSTELSLPSLRKRSSNELESLIIHFASNVGEQKFNVDDTTMKILKMYDWAEGNIRELNNTIRAMTEIHTADNTLFPNSIPRKIYEAIKQQSLYADKIPKDYDDFEFYIKITRDNCTRAEIEKMAFIKLFNIYKDKMTIEEIGKVFGISHATTLRRVKEYEKSGLISLESIRQQHPKKWKD